MVHLTRQIKAHWWKKSKVCVLDHYRLQCQMLFLLMQLSCCIHYMDYHEPWGMILTLLCKMGEVIHFVCNVYSTPSIKDMERTKWGEDGRTYNITGRVQKAPSSSQWQDALRSINFKSTLFRFLAIDWQREDHSNVIKNHEVFNGFDNRCMSFTEDNGCVLVNNQTRYKFSHEEAVILPHYYISRRREHSIIHCSQ